MRPNEIAREIKRGIEVVEQTFAKRAHELAATTRAHDRLMDELERNLDDISEDGLRRMLLTLAADLEDAHTRVISQLDELVTYEMFDPLRVVAADALRGTLMHDR